MSLNLPERASDEYLKKLAKERLTMLRASNPAAKLADAQLEIAREYGFSSWRALKREMDLRRAPYVAELTRACSTGDLDTLRVLLQKDPGLAREALPGGTTALHLAVRHPEAVRLLLVHGANPNARDLGDNATPLHFAAANGALESVRLLLDGGADAHGTGDAHDGDVIGWAARPGNEAVINLLLERGARHHIFSAMALRDRHLVEKLVEEDPDSLLRRRSRFENKHTAVHAAFASPDGLGFLGGQPDYAMLALLIELGADIEARDDKGRTPLEVAMLRGDREAMRLLKAAGAIEPAAGEVGEPTAGLGALGESVKMSDPMFLVRNVSETVRWYESIGFRVIDRYEDGGELVLAKLLFGKCQFGLSVGGTPAPRSVTLWLYTDQVRELYRLLKKRQLEVASATLTGTSDEKTEVKFQADLHQPFYGGWQFSISDPNGLELIFWQPRWLILKEESAAQGST